MEAEIFEKLNKSKSKIAAENFSFLLKEEKKQSVLEPAEKKNKDSPGKPLVSKKSSMVETGGPSPIKKKASLPAKPPTVGSTNKQISSASPFR